MIKKILMTVSIFVVLFVLEAAISPTYVFTSVPLELYYDDPVVFS